MAGPRTELRALQDPPIPTSRRHSARASQGVSIEWIALIWVGLLILFGCSRPSPKTADDAAPAAQQAIVESAAAAFLRMRQNPEFSEMDRYLARARGVMIFPRLVKASFILGGEGGNGVFVARAPDGSWSDPAFYSLGAPSVGLQIGYQEASVVLFFMTDAAVEQALRADFALGASQGVALGRVGERGDTQSEVFSKPIYQMVEAGGVFAGLSLDGYVIGARSKHNVAYYGEGATPHGILIQRAFRNPHAEVLRRALQPSARPTNAPDERPAPTPEPTSEPPAPAAPAPPDGYRACSPESRQAEVCAMIYAPVCGRDASNAQRTFENACRACADRTIVGYTPGACPEQ